MLEVLLFLLNTQKIFKLLETREELIFLIFVEGRANEKKLKGTAAVHALSLSFEFRKGKIWVDEYLVKSLKFSLNGGNFQLECILYDLKLLLILQERV
jgi:hypothetical protein